jgi:hypothetical protein
MVANWEVLVIWLESIVSASEKDAYVEGMVEARIEIGIVSDVEREVNLNRG